MKSFRQEFDDFFIRGTITEIEVGLGACGELRYPSYPEKNGWKFPGIGEFQVSRRRWPEMSFKHDSGQGAEYELVALLTSVDLNTWSLQCYDKYLMKKLRAAAERRGHPEWGQGPDNAGEYNSRPQDTEFFKDKGDYDSYYGRFFLRWYSKTLIEHGDRVLNLAKLAFDEVKIAAKVSYEAVFRNSSGVASAHVASAASRPTDKFAPVCS